MTQLANPGKVSWIAALALVVFLASAALLEGAPVQGGGKGGGGSTPPPNPVIAYVDNGIRVMNEDGTNQKLVVKLSGGEFLDRPAWSPDGTELAYWANHGGVRGIYRQRLDGGGRALVTPLGTDLPRDLDWSAQPGPDGNYKIAFLDTPAPGAWPDVYVVNPDGTGRVNLTNTPERFESYVAWLSDGRLAFQSGSQVADSFLFVCELALVSGQITVVAETLIESGAHSYLAGANTRPAVAFGRIFGSFSRIHRMDVPGSPSLLTAATNSDERYPSFSPDDSKLTFSRTNSGIFTIHADGTNERKISTKGSYPRWKR